MHGVLRATCFVRNTARWHFLNISSSRKKMKDRNFAGQLPTNRIRHKARNPHSFVEFHLESLEDRRMLAGNVTVEVAGDNLVITGDDAANDITVTLDAGEVVVVGNDNVHVISATFVST